MQSLVIRMDDFDYLPGFADSGGWGRADKELMPKIVEINAAVAA